MFKQFIRLFALCLALSLPALALAADDDSDARVIRLSSTGEVKVEPNMAMLSVAVSTEAKTASGAVKDNAAKMDTAVKALRAKLSEKDTLQTGQYQLSPIYHYNRDTKQSTLTGYRVTNQINIEYHNLNKLGDLLDGVVAAGINKVDNLRFGHTDSAALKTKALEQAIAQAKVTANVMAKSAGVSIKGIKEIASFDSNPAPVYREMAMASMDSNAAATQVLPGELTITSSVNMVFNID